jgi:iron(III) transport system substrate-binding protein
MMKMFTSRAGSDAPLLQPEPLPPNLASTARPARLLPTKRLLLLAAALLNFQLGGAVHAQDASAAVLAATALQGANRQQALVDGARKEGTLNLYHTMPSADMNPVIEAFSKKYGIAVKPWRASSEQVLQRTLAEARAGRATVDLVENNSPEMEALHREGLLQKTISPTLADVIPQALPAHREWAGNTIDVFVQAYNTNLVRKEDLPKSYDDLLDPKWKGKLGIEANDMNWFGALAQKLGPEKTTKLFKDIVDKNGISVRNGHVLLANLVASGEVPFALTALNYSVPQLKQQGAPIDMVQLAPAIAYFRGIGVARKAPHPYAAMLFYDFIEGEEGQRILVGRSKIPVLEKLESALDREKITFIDPAQFLDNYAQWTKMYEESVTKRRP